MRPKLALESGSCNKDTRNNCKRTRAKALIQSRHGLLWWALALGVSPIRPLPMFSRQARHPPIRSPNHASACLVLFGWPCMPEKKMKEKLAKHTQGGVHCIATLLPEHSRECSVPWCQEHSRTHSYCAADWIEPSLPRFQRHPTTRAPSTILRVTVWLAFVHPAVSELSPW